MGIPDNPRKPQPRWLDANQTQKRKANTHEKRIAAVMGGKRLPRSGGTHWSKWDKTTEGGDIATVDFLIEHKHTVGESIGVKREWLEKVRTDAKRRRQSPAIVLTFDNGSTPEDWIVLPLFVFEQLQERAKKNG
jgi:hypothetical protein